MTYEYDKVHLALRKAIGQRHGALSDAARRFGCTSRHLQRVLKGEHPDTAVSYLRALGYKVTVTVTVESISGESPSPH